MPKNLSNFRIQQAADYLGVSSKTLRRWGKSGKLVALRSPGNQRYYSKEQLDQYKAPVTRHQPLPIAHPLSPITYLKFAFVWSFLFAVLASPAFLVLISKLLVPHTTQAVLPASASNILAGYTLKVNTPSVFSDTVTFNKDITAPNVLYSLTAGSGISVSTGQMPTITNTGVTSLGGSTGSLSLSAGSGISVSGLSISNSDLGSSQNIFKTVAVSGQDNVVSDSNTDTLTFIASGGVTITNSASTDTITISSANPDYTLSGWTKTGTVVGLTTTTDTVNIGSSALTAGAGTLSSLNVSSGGITNAGAVTGATGLTSSGQITFNSLGGVGILHSNVNGVLSSSAVNLTNGDITGTLAATSGGTGLTTYTTGDIPYSSTTNTLNKLGIGSAGQVLIVSSGIPAWGTITGGSGGVCTDCLVSDPGTTQSILPTSSTATGLIVKQASSGSVDVFKVMDSAGTTSYLRVDYQGNVILGSGQTTSGILTVSPTSTDPIAISPIAMGIGSYTGIITSEDITQARTWTFPDQSGIVCTTAGNCTGTSSSLGGSGTANYLSKWQSTYSLTNSLLYDDGTNIGIGTTSPTSKLHVAGTGNITGAATLGSTLGVTGATTLSSSLQVTGTADLLSTLGVTGATTLSSTVGITGNTTVGGNFMVNGTGTHYFSAGNVGIGTTNPVQKLHVEGQCITGDSLLSVVPANYNPAQEVGSSKLKVERIQIEDVKEGTQVYSLNEETGKIEPHRINKLLDMGVKPVFKLTTVSGKEIRTTGNHPYLVQLTNDELNSRVQLRETEDLAKEYGLCQECLSSDYEFSETRTVWADGSTKESGSLNSSQYSRGQWTISQNGVSPVSLSGQGQSLRSGGLSQTGTGTKVSNPATSQPLTSAGLRTSGNVRGTDQIPQEQELATKKSACADSGDSTQVESNLACHLANTLSQSKNFVKSTNNKGVEVAGFAPAEPWMTSQVPYSSTPTPNSLSQNKTTSSSWTKVIYLQIGDSIAVASDPSFNFQPSISNSASAGVFQLSTSNFEPYVVWDKIQSIEYVGEEQVYDIEVEGTHNFIANGILAHNTYMSGNVGIGDDGTGV